MKILITLASLDIGGAETHVAELASELYRRGHNIVVASGGGVYADYLESLGIKHYTVPLARRNIGDMLVSRKMLKKIIRDEKPDIVHAHARIPAFIVSTLQKCCRFVFVTTVHGAFDTSFVLRHLSGWGDKTLAVSEDLKKYLLTNYDVKEENIYTGINGISSDKFNKNISGDKVIAEFGLPENANRICYVSRLEPDICSCAYQLVEEIEYIAENIENAQLVIVGGGTLFDDLNAKADAVNVKLGRKAVVLTGPRTDVNEIIATADVCVGVSRAILEPMAMEKLCVVAGDPGYIGIMTDAKLEGAIDCNFTCRGCEAVDKRKMADDIISLFNMSHDEKSELRTFAGEVVRKYYSIDKMVTDNEQMYTDAMRELSYDAAILGYYGYGNCGDDALLHAILNDIRGLRPHFSPTVLSYKPLKTMQDYGVRAVNRFDIFAVNKLFKRVKLFIAGGGSLIQDITSTKSLLYYLYVIRLAKRKGIPVMLYGNGIGPIVRPLNKRLASKVLNRVDVITLRDYESLELLKTLGVTKPEIKITADPALGLDKADSTNAQQILKKYGLKDNEKFFCLSVRRWRNMGRCTKAFAEICTRISAEYGLTPVLVPMQYSKDISVSAEIAELAQCRCIIVNESLSADDILGILSLSEGAIAVRLHMLIFGTLLGLPVLGVDYDPKVSSFQRFADLEPCLTIEDFEKGAYMEKADKFFANRDAIKAGIAQRLPEFKAAAEENARIAVELIENEG